MKKIFLGIALLVAATSFADTFNYLTIKQKDKTISIPIEEIEKVTFTVADESYTPELPDYELRILTFEDEDYMGDGNYLGKKNWSSLIDSPQYGGPLLYADYTGTSYKWYDQNNTELCAAIDPDDEGLVYWNGGEAVSNYIDGSYATSQVDYTSQLCSPKGGFEGSKNFCVHFGYFDGIFYDDPRGGIWFHDGKARVVDHMYVCLSSYALSVGYLGNDLCDKATSKDWVKLIAIGTDANGNTHTTELEVCSNGVFNENWQKWDLSVLGEIVRLDFNVESSMSGEYGLNFPSYFLYDNIAVRFPN